MRRAQRATTFGLVSLVVSSLSARSRAEVSIACPQLTSDGAAEVEARTRATLLTAVSPQVEVQIECAPEQATVLVRAQGRDHVVRVDVARPGLEERLIAAVERALIEHSSATTGEPLAPSPSPRSAPRATSAPPAAPARPTTPRAERDADVARLGPEKRPRAAPRTPAPRWRAGVAVAAESWRPQLQYGARALLEGAFGRWAFGLGLGGLTGRERRQAFVASEWHALAFGAFEIRAIAGLRGELGVGVSQLSAAPSAGLLLLSKSTRSAGFAELGVSRPFHFERWGIAPALGLRAFFTSREIVLDGKRVLELSSFNPWLSVTLTYDLARPSSR